jgi:hypothetical protein
LEALVTGVPAVEEAAAKKGTTKTQHVQDLERQLTQSIGTRISIRPGRAKNTGRIMIEYYSLEDFYRITESLGARIES